LYPIPDRSIRAIWLTLNSIVQEQAETEPEPKKQKTTKTGAMKKEPASKTDEPADGATEKKKPGRPKGSGSSEKSKKEKKEPRIGQALRKTRSQGTA
jgi:hypothetical protein